MPDPVTPALTPEEWAEELAWKSRGSQEIRTPAHRHQWPPSDYSGHALAALCLYQQPFGFSRDDVKNLREVAAVQESSALHSLADRIAALLPPEEAA